jgi:copper transport protein
MRRIPLVAAVFGGALVLAAPAGAHALLTRAEPAAGAVVQTPPRQVRLVFDESVHLADGTDVLFAGKSVVEGKPFVPKGRPNEIVIPLRAGLASGPYAVRWSEIDVEDGHVISGAFIFAVRSGLPPTTAIASGGASSGPSASAVVSRGILLSGLLVAAGVVLFAVLVVRRRVRRDALVVAAALAVALLGAVLSVVLQPGAEGTRFGQRTLIGAGVAAVGALAALASARVAALAFVGAAAAILLLGLPPATGHASATDVPRALSIPADVVHLAAVALWIGGLVALLLARRDERPALARQFAPWAVGAVAVLGATGIVRAFNELDAVDQLWTTGYGRALLVKTGVLAAVVAIGLRRRFALELALLAVIVAAVAVLTNVRPGVAYARLAASAHAVVYAGQDRDYAVGVELAPDGDGSVALRATVLGFKGPVSGLGVAFDVDGRRAAAKPCGAGCYAAAVPIDTRPRDVTVRVRDTMLRFAGPSEWPAPDALDIVRKAEDAITSLRTLAVRSHLASDDEHSVTTLYRMVAPNRLAYRNLGGGESVIIGDTRWDRRPGGDWVKSKQFPPIRQPQPFWPPNVTSASVLRTTTLRGRDVVVVSFVDPATPSWFTIWVDRETFRPLQLDMVAAAHFMRDRDGPFNAPMSIDAPAITSR